MKIEGDKRRDRYGEKGGKLRNEGNLDFKLRDQREEKAKARIRARQQKESKSKKSFEGEQSMRNKEEARKF